MPLHTRGTRRPGTSTPARTGVARQPRVLAVPMALGVCLSVGLLAWFGFHAIREWQRSTRLLLQQRTQNAADLLVTALSRDMRAVQDSVLLSARWTEPMLDAPYDITPVLASAFARYPYPESFFGWRGDLKPASVVFFNRADRPPPWRSPVREPDRFPVRVSRDSPVAASLAVRLRKDAARREEFSVFEIELRGLSYQVVARLLYADPFRERLVGGLGFTVNLPWVRQHYFGDLARQVARIGGMRDELVFSILDDDGRLVVGSGTGHADGPVARRDFPLLFVDPDVVRLLRSADLPARNWSVAVEGIHGDRAANSTTAYAGYTLTVSAVAAAVLALGLAMTSRAVRASARLAELRSDFVSTVTHELKTPLATIRAAGDSVASGRVTGDRTVREYAMLVVQESKRLARLVDNLLAYARITDVTEAYRFEPLDLHELVDEALHGFAGQIQAKGFAVDVHLPLSLPSIEGDRTAIGMMLDNLIDNALRYSGAARRVTIRAAARDGAVELAIADEGIGIPSHELEHVTQRFFRGRRAGSGGSGLGLAIVNRIVEAHGGRLSIHSVVERGTTVTLTLAAASTGDAEEAHSRR
ncbi:MAG TPA: HAMP domain-containing sensor histidine kinase [Vicinamibacterales bacterium]|nr:HAMP domain-containing sensor histidine kinase [Vicinamibacterales bacterium]